MLVYLGKSPWPSKWDLVKITAAYCSQNGRNLYGDLYCKKEPTIGCPYDNGFGEAPNPEP